MSSRLKHLRKLRLTRKMKLMLLERKLSRSSNVQFAMLSTRLMMIWSYMWLKITTFWTILCTTEWNAQSVIKISVNSSFMLKLLKCVCYKAFVVQQIRLYEFVVRYVKFVTSIKAIEAIEEIFFSWRLGRVKKKSCSVDIDWVKWERGRRGARS